MGPKYEKKSPGIDKIIVLIMKDEKSDEKKVHKKYPINRDTVHKCLKR